MRGWAARNVLRPTAVALACAVSAWAAQGHAAVADRLCSPYGAATLAAYPTADALRSAATATERQVARRGPADSAPILTTALDPPTDSAERPSAAALAEYCSATGELMRVSPQGSQLQAQSYLLGAFRMAQASGLESTASVAAYRLGLVSLSGSTASGTRGSRRASRGPTAAVRDAEQVGARGAGPCDFLLTANPLTSSNLSLSVASLACSAERAARVGDARTAALADLRLARLRLSIAETNEAVAADFRAQAWAAATAGMTVARGIEDPALRAEILGRLVSTALDARPGPAPELVPVVAAIRSADARPDAASFAAALDARLALAAGDRARALALMEEALLLESQRALPSRLPEWRLRLADIDPARREAHVLAAYDALEAVRPLLPRFDPLTEETTFALHMRRVFQSAVDVQLAGAAGGAELIRVRGAQQIVEAYRQAELQSVFGSECIPQRNPLTPETLAQGEVLLYPILLPDRLELLYVAGGANGATFRRLAPNRSVDRQSISRLVETAVLSLNGGEDDDWRPAARQLYDLLIKPIEGDLAAGALLVVVPDGALRGLPFSVLLDADNRYLIQRARVAVAPSLAYSQPGSNEEAQDQQLVAASLELEVDLPAGRFEKLVGTGSEARLAAVTDGRRIGRSWVIENFRKADLVAALTREQVDVLHLATHASFNGRSDRAFIVANGEVILLSELRQILSANRARGEELDLLVLSACETAVGDDEASMGLAGAAVQAGAKSAIASLWPVNDVGTAALMKDFYQSYRSGESKSQALRDAQLKLIDGGGVNASPTIWAAFTLLGAWR